MSAPPWVSIGIPTRNRSESLARAVKSALSQTFADLEVVICDNASTDDTPDLCRRLVSADRRVRYFRHASDIGLSPNFNFVLSRSCGRFFMWLADDDWLDEDYVAKCLSALRDLPDAYIAYGRVTFHLGQHESFEPASVSLLQNSGSIRVLKYLRVVAENGMIQGLMHRSVLERVPPIRNTFGDDWLLIASVAFQGKVVLVSDTSVHRSAAGLSKDVSSLARYYGRSGRSAVNPYNRLAWKVFWDVGLESPAYDSLPRFRRLIFGAACASVVATRHNLISWRKRFIGPAKRAARRKLKLHRD
jgi:glycosyltransferase involved in cell wall biosynthesis